MEKYKNMNRGRYLTWNEKVSKSTQSEKVSHSMKESQEVSKKGYPKDMMFIHYCPKIAQSPPSWNLKKNTLPCEITNNNTNALAIKYGKFR